MPDIHNILVRFVEPMTLHTSVVSYIHIYLNLRFCWHDLEMSRQSHTHERGQPTHRSTGKYFRCSSRQTLKGSRSLHTGPRKVIKHRSFSCATAPPFFCSFVQNVSGLRPNVRRTLSRGRLLESPLRMVLFCVPLLTMTHHLDIPFFSTRGAPMSLVAICLFCFFTSLCRSSVRSSRKTTACTDRHTYTTPQKRQRRSPQQDDNDNNQPTHTAACRYCTTAGERNTKGQDAVGSRATSNDE